MKLKGHPVPKKMKETDIEGNPKDSTEKKELERLYVKTGDPFYSKIVEYREYDKMKGTYVDGFLPSKDGCVHTTFTFAPAIGQLSSRNPNIQNIPVHPGNERQRRIINQFRRMIVAHPGHHMVEFDFKSFFIITMGFMAKDAAYIRMGRLDMHSFVTAWGLKLPGHELLASLPDDELRERLKWIKAHYEYERNAKFKHAALGYNNGLGPRKMFQTYREYFTAESECKRILDMMDSLFPIAAQFRKDICQLAHKQTYLMTPYQVHPMVLRRVPLGRETAEDDQWRRSRGRYRIPHGEHCLRSHQGQDDRTGSAGMAGTGVHGQHRPRLSPVPHARPNHGRSDSGDPLDHGRP